MMKKAITIFKNMVFSPNLQYIKFAGRIRLMIDKILAQFAETIKDKMEEWSDGLNKNFDFNFIENILNLLLKVVSGQILQTLINDFLESKEVLKKLKLLGGQMGMRFKEYKKVRVRVYNGQTIEVTTPFFIKADRKRGRKKRGPNGRGSHLGLELLGFIGHCSMRFTSFVVKSAVLCPSFCVAKEILSDQEIDIDVKTIRRLCERLGKIGVEMRGDVSLEGNEELKGHTLVIGIDGGRLRERKTKRGKKRADQKRQGYTTDWKEPKLFTIYMLNDEGEVVKDFKPIHDATMGNHEDMFALLKRYLGRLQVSEVSRLVFSGDGIPWIWSGVRELKKELGWDNVHEVIDYTHAKQNINKIKELIPSKNGNKQKITDKWHNLLWKGNIDDLYEEICKTIKGRNKGKAVKKWENYFKRNKDRMQYEKFKEQHIPCGSGCVESAIRRVINLRLKSAGTFWLRHMAEFFLFLRSQLLSGRWNIFIKNVVHRHKLTTSDI
jgi:hypothetical protein